MNVYDFDHTIYRGDSTLDFWRYCLRRHPAALRALPAQIAGMARFLCKRCDRADMKRAFYAFLRYVPDAGQAARRFWDSRFDRVEQWYLAQKRDDDLVISASPRFLLAPVCERLGVRLIASEVDAATGALKGANCRAEEKLARYRAEYGGTPIERFYSDSLSDAPMAAQAKEAYRVRRGERSPWQLKHGSPPTQ